MSVMQLGHLLTRSGLTYLEVSSEVCHTRYKTDSKILNMKLQDFLETFMKEPQNGFRKGRPCTDSTFCLKLLIEKKRREFNLEIRLLLMDYEKAFDSIQRQISFTILKSRHIPDTLSKATMDIYT